VVDATNLWHLRPVLAVLMVVVAVAAVVAGVLERGRTVTAVGAAVVTVLVAVDALTVDGVRWLVHFGSAYSVGPSAWALLPVAGGVGLCLVLLCDTGVPWVASQAVADAGNHGAPASQGP
jgi:hypothetical protein